MYVSVYDRSSKSKQYLIKFGDYKRNFRGEFVNNLLLVSLVEILET